MNHEALTDRLERMVGVLPVLVSGVSAEELRRRSPAGAWSILEILGHLADEEVSDFRARLAFVLEGREPPWPGIDPEGWARERKYNEQDPAEVLARWVRERRASVEWLRSLPAGTDWSLAYVHPKLGPIRAGDLLASWAAHDALHLRQIAKRLWEGAGRDGEGYGTGYAGEWGV